MDIKNFLFNHKKLSIVTVLIFIGGIGASAFYFSSGRFFQGNLPMQQIQAPSFGNPQPANSIPATLTNLSVSPNPFTKGSATPMTFSYTLTQMNQTAVTDPKVDLTIYKVADYDQNNKVSFNDVTPVMSWPDHQSHYGLNNDIIWNGKNSSNMDVEGQFVVEAVLKVDVLIVKSQQAGNLPPPSSQQTYTDTSIKLLTINAAPEVNVGNQSGVNPVSEINSGVVLTSPANNIMGVSGLTATPNPYIAKGTANMLFSYNYNNGTTTPPNSNGPVDAKIFKKENYGKPNAVPEKAWLANPSKYGMQNSLTWDGKKQNTNQLADDGDYVFEVSFQGSMGQDPNGNTIPCATCTANIPFSIQTPPATISMLMINQSNQFNYDLHNKVPLTLTYKFDKGGTMQPHYTLNFQLYAAGDATKTALKTWSASPTQNGDSHFAWDGKILKNGQNVDISVGDYTLEGLIVGSQNPVTTSLKVVDTTPAPPPAADKQIDIASCSAALENPAVDNKVIWSAKVTGGVPDGATYLWSSDEINGTNQANVATPHIAYVASGTKKAKVKISAPGYKDASKDCASILVTIKKEVAPPALPELSVTCSGKVILPDVPNFVTWSFDVTGAASNTTYKYVWSGDGIDGTNQINEVSPQVKYEKEGTKKVKILVAAEGYKEASAECTLAVKKTNIQPPPPGAKIPLKVACFGDPEEADIGEPVDWYAFITNAAPDKYTYSWSGSNTDFGSKNHQESPEVTYMTSGTKHASITVSAPGYTDSELTVCNSVEVKTSSQGDSQYQPFTPAPPAALAPPAPPAAVTLQNGHAACDAFNDVSAKDCDAWKYAKTLGVVGKSEGMAYPNDVVQRDEFARINKLVFSKYLTDLDPIVDSKTQDCTQFDRPFLDIDAQDWSCGDFLFWKERGVFTGYLAGADKGKVLPAKPVSNAEVATVLGRNLVHNGLAKLPLDISNGHNYRGVKPNEWYSRFIGLFFKLKVSVWGPDFYADQYMRRGDLIQLLFDLHNQKII